MVVGVRDEQVDVREQGHDQPTVLVVEDMSE